MSDISAILADAQDITPDISQKLGTFFGVSAMLLYGIQQNLKARAEMRELATA